MEVDQVVEILGMSWSSVQGILMEEVIGCKTPNLATEQKVIHHALPSTIFCIFLNEQCLAIFLR